MDWDVLLYPPKGTNLYDAIEEFLRRRDQDDKVIGFVFNWRVVLAGPDDGHAELLAKYQAAGEPTTDKPSC